MILLLLACSPAIEEVTMYGTTWDTPKAEGSPVAGVTLRSLMDDATTEVGTAESDESGIFYLTMPAGMGFFVTLEKEGYAPTAFSGSAGVADFYAGLGLPWIVSDDWVEDVRATWSGCTGGSEGNFLVGEARLPVPGVDDDQALPTAPDARVTFTASDGSSATACYLDETGVPDPDATGTSSLGSWAIFGVVEGPGLVDVTVDTETGTSSEIYKALVPEGGLAGLYPVLVPES